MQRRKYSTNVQSPGCLITPYHMAPPSVRVMQLLRILGWPLQSAVIHPPKTNNIIRRLLHLRKAIHQRKVRYRSVIVYDLLTLIALADIFMMHPGRVTYDCTDYFPGYYAFQLGYPRNRLLKKSMEFIEKTLSRMLCRKVVVNSKFLKSYHAAHKNTIYLSYESPLARLGIHNQHDLPRVAFVYLGVFSKDKGSDEFLSLSHRLQNCSFFVFGASPPSTECPKNVSFLPRIPIDQLAEEIRQITTSYFVVGASIIHSDNPSYAVQEANKDIDYLACGFPIIGNRRQPTAEKILAGAGLFYDDHPGLARLLSEPTFRQRLSQGATSYYRTHYTSNRLAQRRVAL